MPHSVRECAKPGCHFLIRDAKGCPTHPPRPPGQWGGVDRRKKNAAERGYNGAWNKARKFFLAAHPYCAACQRGGKVRGANVVDHIVPHRGDKGRFWDRGNWQPLCKRCHAQKTRAGL